MEMLKILPFLDPYPDEQISWIQRLKGNYKNKRLIDAKIPELDSLKDAHYERYKENILVQILNYNKFIDGGLHRDLSQGVNELSLESSNSLDSSVDSSSEYSSITIDQPSQDANAEISEIYKVGVRLLKNGETARGKDMIKEAAYAGNPHAMYAYAIIKFKEVPPSDTSESIREADCNTQEMIEESVHFMLEARSYFFPLHNFVLGMMQLYNFKGYGHIIESKSLCSWKIHLFEVLRATKGTPFMNRIKESNIFSCSPLRNYSFFEPKQYMFAMGPGKGIEDLEWMVRCVEYELAMDMISNSGNKSVAKFLLEELSSVESVSFSKILSNLADAKYTYAYALLKGVFYRQGRDVLEKAYTHLNEAVDLYHREALLLFGTLPFRGCFEFLREGHRVADGRQCFYCLEKYISAEYPGDERFTKAAACLVAKEYLHKDSPFVAGDLEKARNILKGCKCSYALETLNRRLQKRKEKAGNETSDTLKCDIH